MRLIFEKLDAVAAWVGADRLIFAAKENTFL